MRLEPGAQHPGRRLGFTLIELLVVITIIGIIIVFLLVAAQDARRRAEEDATLALITKLEGGINDRLDTLLQNRPDPNPAHFYMAGIYDGSMDNNNNLAPLGWQQTFPQGELGTASTRAQVFAWYDYIKSELPDVFFVQNFNPGQYDYPLNFAFPAKGYPGPTIDARGYGNFMLPIGNSVAGPLNQPPGFIAGYGAGNLSNTVGTGIYGASYFAAGGLYKNLGYYPIGYDGIDNNANGLIDEWSEGTDANNAAQVQQRLQLHTHNTARAETLYAILVEGVGPLGSFFNRDDFSDREVKDTDGDGLPEFVDAWGQPLQFFRWPILYSTNTQKGQVIDTWDYTQTPPAAQSTEIFNPPYRSVFQAREQDPLDANQLLQAPAWWSSLVGANPQSPFATTIGGTAASAGGSGGVMAFEYFFHRLTEPYPYSSGATQYAQFYWDRGTTYPNRRAFFSKPLILSSGPDQQLGVYLCYPSQVFPTPPLTLNAANLINFENNAIPFDPTLFGNNGTIPFGTTIPAGFRSAQLRDYGRDDISNQNRQATAGLGGS